MTMRTSNLEIPVDTVDFVRPGRSAGPWTVRSLARRGASIQKGHHLFGHAQIQCPTCETVHEYWVFVHVGNTGWYAELKDGETSRAGADLADLLNVRSRGCGTLEEDPRSGAARPTGVHGNVQLSGRRSNVGHASGRACDGLGATHTRMATVSRLLTSFLPGQGRAWRVRKGWSSQTFL